MKVACAGIQRSHIKEHEMNQFSFEVSSDLDYEKMVVNLNFANNQVAVLNCDNGIENVEIFAVRKHVDVHVL
jgi:hypothetical protein